MKSLLNFLILVGFLVTNQGFAQTDESPFEQAFKILSGSGDVNKVSPDGHKYQIFYVEKHAALSKLFNEIHRRILTTQIGLEICKNQLQSDPKELIHHFSLDFSIANELADICRNSFSETGVVDTFNSEKSITHPMKRRFRIVVSNNPNVALDSWTDAYQNQTLLYIHHSQRHSDINFRYFVQALAHETAIYFDAKSWPGGPGWNQSPTLSDTQFLSGQIERAQLAAIHPTISNVLSFIRAYKIERQMVRELMSNGSLGTEPIFYPVTEYPFLRISCRKECLRDFIMTHKKWLEPLALPLLASSPQYRSRRLESVQSQNPYGIESQEATYLLNELPVLYMLNSNLQDDPFSPLNLTDSTLATPNERSLVSQYLNGRLLIEDLAILQSTLIRTGPDSSVDYLSFLTLPLLGKPQLNYSSGPRPRIRTGGTQ